MGFLLSMLLPSCEPERAAMAMAEKLDGLQNALQAVGVDIEIQLELFFRAFKTEKILEIWVKDQAHSSFSLLKSYPICQTSGKLGPKRQEGDCQVPEGVYQVNRFNPKSIFHLSLGLDYPNAADLAHGDPDHPGGDIFVHGACQSTGCLAMTDDFIKEIYTLGLLAKASGQERIPVHIFPIKMTNENMRQLVAKQPEHAAFWKELQPIFQFFEAKRKVPDIVISSDGKYFLGKNAAAKPAYR